MQWNSLGKSREKRTSPLRLWPTVSIVPDLGTGPARRYRELYGSSLGSDRPPRGPRYPIRASRDWSDGTRTPTTPFREHIALEDCSDVLRLLPMRLHVAFHELENQVLNGVLAARHGGGRSLWGRDPASSGFARRGSMRCDRSSRSFLAWPRTVFRFVCAPARPVLCSSIRVKCRVPPSAREDGLCAGRNHAAQRSEGWCGP